MKKYIFLLTILALSFLRPDHILAQDRTIDSLLTLLKSDKEDTNKVKHLVTLGRIFGYQKIDYPLSLNYLEKALLLDTVLLKEIQTADEIKIEKKRIAFISRIEGEVYQASEQYAKALASFIYALKVGEENENKRSIAAALNSLGWLYSYLSDDNQSLEDNHKALDYFSRALKIGEILKDTLSMATSLNGLNGVYGLEAEYIGNGPKRDSLLDLALEYLTRCLKITSAQNSINLATNFGETYMLMGNYPKALDYYFKAYDFTLKSSSFADRIITSGNMGMIYAKDPMLPSPPGEVEKGYKLSAKYLYRALALADSFNQQSKVQWIYDELSQLYGRSDLPLIDTVGGRSLSMVEMQKRSMLYYKRAMIIKERTYTEESKKKETELELKYESEKKEAELKLEKEKEELAFENKEHLQYLGIFSFVILVFSFLFILTRMQISLKAIDFVGFVGVLLFFQFLEVLLHPFITKYTHGNPIFFMGVSVALASTIKPLHHLIGKRLIAVSHTANERHRLRAEQKQREMQERIRQFEEEERRKEEENNSKE